MTKLGIMEGRLVPPEAGRFQAFPRERWSEEFGLAATVPLSYIEWIYDRYGADVNPLAHDVSRMRSLIAQTGVAVRSICADYFMESPFFGCASRDRIDRQALLAWLIEVAQQIGARRIVIPFVDGSAMTTEAQMDAVGSVLSGALSGARAAGVELHLETSLNPGDFSAFLDRVTDPMIKVNYDTGNSASLGYRPREEFKAYGSRIGSVHIKDRGVGAGTVALGTGSTDFKSVFDGLEKIGYAGDFTLQVARSSAGSEVDLARRSRAFVARYWEVE